MLVKGRFPDIAINTKRATQHQTQPNQNGEGNPNPALGSTRMVHQTPAIRHSSPGDGNLGIFYEALCRESVDIPEALCPSPPHRLALELEVPARSSPLFSAPSGGMELKRFPVTWVRLPGHSTKRSAYLFGFL